MLSLAPPRSLHAPAQGPGAFAWRYVDMVDAAGDGAVLIWGWSLPFLGHDPEAPAADHPFLNLVTYQGGRPSFYHLELFDPSGVEPVSGGWRFGRNLLQSECAGDRFQVHASLDLPVAGRAERALGELTLDGPAAFGHPAATGPHQWAILSAAAAGTLTLRAPQVPEIRIAGRAYHDENHCDRPLTQLGITEWAWGRLAEVDHERVHYVCEGERGSASMDIFVWPSGRMDVGELRAWAGEGRVGGRWGLSAPAWLTAAEQRIAAGPTVDESSFYLRFPLSTSRGRGWGERVRPGAIRNRWMQTLVHLCVTRPGGRGSFLLPWFSGPRADRLARTWSWWWS